MLRQQSDPVHHTSAHSAPDLVLGSGSGLGIPDPGPAPSVVSLLKPMWPSKPHMRQTPAFLRAVTSASAVWIPDAELETPC